MLYSNTFFDDQQINRYSLYSTFCEQIHFNVNFNLFSGLKEVSGVDQALLLQYEDNIFRNDSWLSYRNQRAISWPGLVSSDGGWANRQVIVQPARRRPSGGPPSHRREFAGAEGPEVDGGKLRLLPFKPPNIHGIGGLWNFHSTQWTPYGKRHDG